MNEQTYEWMGKKKNNNNNNNCNNALVKRSIVIRLDTARHLPQQWQQSQQRVATKSGTVSQPAGGRQKPAIEASGQGRAADGGERGWGQFTEMQF